MGTGLEALVMQQNLLHGFLLLRGILCLFSPLIPAYSLEPVPRCTLSFFPPRTLPTWQQGRLRKSLLAQPSSVLCHLPAGPHHHHPSCSHSHHPPHSSWCLEDNCTSQFTTLMMKNKPQASSSQHSAPSKSPGGTLKYYCINILFAVVQPAQQLDGAASSFRTSQLHLVPLQLLHYLAVGWVSPYLKRGLWMVVTVLAVCIFINCYAKI